MATQNHTATFLSFRENYKRRNKHKKTAVNPVLNGEDEEAQLWNPKYSLPPVWVDSKDACESAINWIQDNMTRLDESHRNRLMVRIDDEMEGATDREIDILTRALTKKFREAEVKLKEIGKKDKKSATNEDMSVRLNVQRSLATKLQTLSLQFRKSQKEYMGKLKVQKQYTFDISDDYDQNTSSSSAFLLSQDEEQVNLSSKIHERDQEIGRIAKSIEELALVFKELAVLVIEQGSVLDRIDYNMDLVVDRTAKGVSELEIAEKYQKSTRALWCIGILVFLIVIFFIILMMKFS